MDYNQLFAVSAAGMSLERTRVEIASMNLANANTIQTPDGPGYRPMQVVARNIATPFTAFSDIDGLDGDADVQTGIAPQTSIAVLPADVQPKLVSEPGNPYANKEGFVTYPGVDAATETITMMTAMRSYEANVAALNMARNLALKTLEIGG